MADVSRVNEILGRFPGPVELTPSRRKWTVILAIAVLFVAIGVWELASGQVAAWLAWLVIVFFGIGALLSLVAMLPGRGGLALDLEGFAIRTVMGKTWRNAWTEASGFQPGDGHLSRMVVYDDAAASARHPAMGAVATALAGRSAALPDTYGWRPADLAALMNRWRERALGGR